MHFSFSEKYVRRIGGYSCLLFVVLQMLFQGYHAQGLIDESMNCDGQLTVLDVVQSQQQSALFSLGLTLMEMETFFLQPNQEYTIFIPSDEVFREAFGEDILMGMMMENSDATSMLKSIFKYHAVPKRLTLNDLQQLPENHRLETFFPDSSISVLLATESKVILQGMEGETCQILQEIPGPCSSSIYIIDSILLPVLPQHQTSQENTNPGQLYEEESILNAAYTKGMLTVPELNNRLWGLIKNEQTSTQQPQATKNTDILVNYIENRLKSSQNSQNVQDFSGIEPVAEASLDLEEGAGKDTPSLELGGAFAFGGDLGNVVPSLEGLDEQTLQKQEKLQLTKDAQQNFTQINTPNYDVSGNVNITNQNDVLPPSLEQNLALSTQNSNQDQNLDVQMQNRDSQKLQPLTLVKSPNFEWWRENVIKAPPPPPPSAPQMDLPQWDVQYLVSLGLQIGSPVPGFVISESPYQEVENFQPSLSPTQQISESASISPSVSPEFSFTNENFQSSTEGTNPYYVTPTFTTINLSAYQQQQQQSPAQQTTALNQPFASSSVANLGSFDQVAQFSKIEPTTVSTLDILNSVSGFNQNTPPIPSPDLDEQLVEGFANVLQQLIPQPPPIDFPCENYENQSSTTTTTILSSNENSCEDKSALEIISEIPELSTFRLAIVYNQMENYFNDIKKAVTIFAPSNEAFKELSVQYQEGVLPKSQSNANILQDSDMMTDILGYHVVPALTLSYDNLQDMGEEQLGTMGGTSGISLVPWQDIVLLQGAGNNAAIVEKDVGNSCNVALHVVDSVLLPFKMQGEGGGSSSMQFQSLQRRSAQSERQKTPVYVYEGGDRACTPLIQMLSQQPELALYHQLLEDSGLSDLIRDRSDLTVFAPSDAALGKVMDAISTTGGISQETMQLMLAYHIVQGDWHRDALVDGTQLGTITADAGGTQFNLSVERRGQNTQINGLSNSVQIVGPNRYACGSMIHIVDGVLLPIAI